MAFFHLLKIIKTGLFPMYNQLKYFHYHLNNFLELIYGQILRKLNLHKSFLNLRNNKFLTISQRLKHSYKNKYKCTSRQLIVK